MRNAENRVFDAAAEGKGDVTVSGDQHFLHLKAWQSISIESPAAFIIDSEDRRGGRFVTIRFKRQYLEQV